MSTILVCTLTPNNNYLFYIPIAPTKSVHNYGTHTDDNTTTTTTTLKS